MPLENEKKQKKLDRLIVDIPAEAKSIEAITDIIMARLEETIGAKSVDEEEPKPEE